MRYWEDKGLFHSKRDPQSGWRIYDDETVCRIRLVLALRELDIAIKDVKTILDSKDKNIVLKIMEKQIQMKSPIDIQIKEQDFAKSLFYADSIAVIGASNTRGSWGFMVFQQLINSSKMKPDRCLGTQHTHKQHPG